MNDVEKLLALEELRGVKARYFRAVDTKDWALMRSLFAPAAVFDIGDDVPGRIVIGADAIVEAASKPMVGCVSVHHGHCPEIEITSDTTATGIWAMEDMLCWGEESPRAGAWLHGFGHYFETYEKVEGRWLITSLKLKRLRVTRKQARASA